MNNQNNQGKALIFFKESDIVHTNVYSTIITNVPFTKQDFHMIGKSYYPNKSLTNRIAQAAGVVFDSNLKFERTFREDVKNGVAIKIHDGYLCVKQGSRRGPDGTWLKSSPCIYEYNFLDRAEELFLKDMENIGKKFNDGNPKQKYNFPDNPQKESLARRALINDLKKKGNRMASTGAELAVIRELIGMPTGFTENDLKAGSIQVAQIGESTIYQNSKAQANIQAIREGKSNIGKIANLLGDGGFSEYFDRPNNQAQNTASEKPADNNQKILTFKETYQNEYQKCTDRFKDWLDEQENSTDKSEQSYKHLLDYIQEYNYGYGNQQ